MKIIEQFIMSKTGREDTCEDIIFSNDAFIAVIDGAAARDKSLYAGKQSGRAAAEIVRDTLSGLPEGAALEHMLQAVTCAFRVFCEKNSININDYSKRLTASAAIYSAAQMEIWMVGECRAMIDGVLYDNPNGMYEHAAAVRAMINQAEIKKCRSREWIMQNDPGAEFIGPLLNELLLFQNSEASRENGFSYCAFDGFDIDPALVKVLPVLKGSEIALGSDGYPMLCATLYESEKKLSALIEADPMCIYENRCVKGVAPGNESYDDRSYIRFKV